MHTPPVILMYVHNSLPTLAALLSSLPSHSPRTPLLVVDDSSTDGSADLLRGLAVENRLELLQTAGPPHRTRALNAGFARAEALYPGRDVLRLHADTLPEAPPDSTTPFSFYLSSGLGTLNNCGMLGVRLVTPEGQIWEQGRRVVCGLGLSAPDRHLLRWRPDEEPAPATPAIEVDAVSGACVLYRHEALAALRGANYGTVLDEHYGSKGLEEEDTCFALRRLGFSVGVLPGLRAVHLGLLPPPEGAAAPELARRLAKEKQLLEAQAELWTHKWGWDPLLPDMGEIRRLYGHTPVCRRVGASLAHTDPDPAPAVDVCMVTWNGATVLPRCLESLAATEYPPERLTLWIMDNASTDATPEILARFAASCPFAVRVERLLINTGAIIGLNWAFSRGTAPLVAKLDDDIVVPPDWLRKLARVFTSRPYAGVVGPCVVDDSPVGLVQCADFAYHPTAFAHELENAEAQWPGLARVSHVRGCCNLYRRDVFARCGLLDIGYSPSQWDDPDHHVALLHEGYEVIYAGHVRVAHKCTLRHRPSTASLTTGAMHKATMLAKWGTNAPELLECALLLSREGRFVEDAPQPDLTEQTGQAAPHTFQPAPTDKSLQIHMATRCAAILQDEGGLSPVLPGLARQLRDSANRSLADGLPGKALGELRTALCCGAGDPGYAHTLHGLADLLETLGAPSPVLRRRAQLFGPRQASAPLAASRFPIPQTPHLSQNPSKLHLAFCVPHALRHDADLHALLESYAAPLRLLGHTVTLHAGPTRLPHAHIAHFWTFGHPHETLRHLRYLRSNRPDLALLLTPLWHDPAFSAAVPELAKAVQAGLTPHTPLPSAPAHEGDAPLLRRRVLALLDGLLPLSPAETNGLGLPPQHNGGFTLPLPGLPLPLPASPVPFREAGGPAGFVLAAAPFHPAANQAALLTALQSFPIPVVLPGAAREPWYLHACRRLNPKALFVDELPPDLLASALAGARLVALPSLEPAWSFASRLAVTAASLGIPVVCPQGAPATVLATAFPCNPISIPDISRAIREALTAPQTVPSTISDTTEALLTCYTRLRS